MWKLKVIKQQRNQRFSIKSYRFNVPLPGGIKRSFTVNIFNRTVIIDII